MIDIETTGFNHKTDCILERGVVELNTDTRAITELLDIQIKENHLSGKHHNPWIFQNDFMTHDDVRNAENLAFHFDKTQSIFDNYLGRICAWNIAFYADFLKSRGFNLGKDIKDPMKESATFFNLPYKKTWFRKMAFSTRSLGLIISENDKN